MKWMFPYYVTKKGIKLTHLANDCAEELNLSVQVLRIKLSEWNNNKEVPKQDQFIQRLIVIAKQMDVPVRSLLGLDDKENLYEVITAHQLELSNKDIITLNADKIITVEVVNNERNHLA